MSHNKTLSFPDKDWVLINNYFARHPREQPSRILRDWVMQGLIRDDPEITSEKAIMLEQKETDVRSVAKFLSDLISEKGRIRNESVEGIVSAGMNIQPTMAKKFTALILKAPHLYGLRWDVGFINIKGT